MNVDPVIPPDIPTTTFAVIGRIEVGPLLSSALPTKIHRDNQRRQLRHIRRTVRDTAPHLRADSMPLRHITQNVLQRRDINTVDNAFGGILRADNSAAT